MNKNTPHIIFIVFIIAAFLSILYHLKGIFYPTTDAPAWRHALFILINIITIYGLLKRPGWFAGFIAVLTLQQWYSHGSYAYLLWKQEHSIHWISIAIIIFLPVLFLLLLIDKQKKRHEY